MSSITNAVKLDSLIWRAWNQSEDNRQRGILKTPFQCFLDQCETVFSQPVSTLAEARALKSTKTRGDLFEEFCCRVLKSQFGYIQVWRLSDLSNENLAYFNLGRQDMGIDLIAKNAIGYAAVQCKFKGNSSLKSAYKGHIAQRVGWKDVSTFHNLCNRTGPWTKHIVMTSGKSVKISGHRQPTDYHICFGSFNSITGSDWLGLMIDKGQILGSTENKNAPDNTNATANTNMNANVNTNVSVKDQAGVNFDIDIQVDDTSELIFELELDDTVTVPKKPETIDDLRKARLKAFGSK